MSFKRAIRRCIGRSSVPLAVALVAMMVGLAGCSSTSGFDRRTGVSRLSDGRVELHYALCSGEKMRVVRVEELIGGSRTPYGVPIYWQIESPSGSERELYTVGEAPDGFIQTVALTRKLPEDELLGIEGTRQGLGMSFEVNSLSERMLLRGTYDSVTPEQFRKDADDECTATRAGGFALSFLVPIVLGALAIVIIRVRRASRAWITRSALIMGLAIVGGTCLAQVYDGLRNYKASAVGVVVGAAAALVVGTMLGAVLSPVLMAASALFGRLRGRAELLARAGAGVAVALVLWLLIGDLSVWTLCWAVSLGLGVAVVPVRGRATVEKVQRWRVRRPAMVVVAMTALASGLLSLITLDNSPEGLSPAARFPTPNGSPPSISIPENELVLVDRQLDGNRATSLEFTSNAAYVIRVTCTNGWVQVSEGYATLNTTYGRRRVVPCDAQPFRGAYSNVDRGTEIHVFVDASGSVDGRVVISSA